MSRRALFLAGLLAVALAMAVGLVAAHGNHATANAQVSANGTVVVEQLFLSERGHLVLRADDDGQPGEVLGHRTLDRGRYSGVRVGMDRSYWQTVSGNVTVWAVLHSDDGDGQFDSDDELLYWFDQPAGDRIPVAKGDAPASVVTTGAGSLSDDGLTVDEATLARDGHLVVHESNGSLGPALGSRPLPAGRHTDATVSANASGADALLVAVHGDDGDGQFDPDADQVVRAGGEPVASRYEPTAGGPVGITTPTGQPDTEAGESPGTSVDGAGFGVVVAALALVVSLLALHRRRR